MSKVICPDCGAEMQRIMRLFRCPWASEERMDQARWRNAPFVPCGWPLDHPRRIEGLPDEPGGLT
jgi:hypothetical protein